MNMESGTNMIFPLSSYGCFGNLNLRFDEDSWTLDGVRKISDPEVDSKTDQSFNGIHYNKKSPSIHTCQHNVETDKTFRKKPPLMCSGLITRTNN